MRQQRRIQRGVGMHVWIGAATFVALCVGVALFVRSSSSAEQTPAIEGSESTEPRRAPPSLPDENPSVARRSRSPSQTASNPERSGPTALQKLASLVSEPDEARPKERASKSPNPDCQVCTGSGSASYERVDWFVLEYFTAVADEFYEQTTFRRIRRMGQTFYDPKTLAETKKKLVGRSAEWARSQYMIKAALELDSKDFPSKDQNRTCLCAGGLQRFFQHLEDYSTRRHNWGGL